MKAVVTEEKRRNEACMVQNAAPHAVASGALFACCICASWRQCSCRTSAAHKA
jgi:hypothetical protein